METEASQFKDADWMRWALLRTKAQDKAFITHTSDSVMKWVVDFYDRKGTVHEQAEAHYYLASVYRDLHDSPRAVVHFLKSLDLSESSSLPDASLMMRCCSQLSVLFAQQLNEERALEMAEKGVDIGRKNHLLTPTLLADVAIRNVRMKDSLTAIRFYREALDLIKREGIDRYYAAAIMAEAMAFYSSYGLKAEAKECYDLLTRLPKKERPQNFISAIADYFENQDMVDSAIMYNMVKWSCSRGLYARQEATRSLMQLYHRLGREDSASYYGVLYAAANDSVAEMLKMEQTRNVLNFYRYQRDMEEEAQAYRDASLARIRWLTTIAVAVVLFLMCGLYYVSNLLRKERLIRQQKQVITEKELAIQEANTALQKKKKQNVFLSQLMLSANREALSEEIFKTFRDAAEGKEHITTDTHWQQLLTALDSHYPHFSSNILERCPGISSDKMHIACLMKLGMDNNEIRNITELPKSTYYRIVKQLQNDLGDVLL